MYTLMLTHFAVGGLGSQRTREEMMIDICLTIRTYSESKASNVVCVWWNPHSMETLGTEICVVT